MASREREEWHRQYQEEQRNRAEAEQRRKDEEKKVAELEEMTQRWHKSQSILQFVSTVEERASRNGPLDPASSIAKRIAWARNHAQQIDPIR